MKRYAVYNKDTGEIDSWGYCTDIDFGRTKKLKPKQAVIELLFPPQELKNNYKVVGEELVEKRN